MMKLASRPAHGRQAPRCHTRARAGVRPYGLAISTCSGTLPPAPPPCRASGRFTRRDDAAPPAPLITSDATALLRLCAASGRSRRRRGLGAHREDGTRYLDSSPGSLSNALAITTVFRDAVLRALESGLVHVSNLYRTEPGERLAAS